MKTLFMRKNIKILFSTTVALFIIVSESYAGLFGPSNYDECIAEYVPKNITNLGVPIITAACRMKFREKINEDYAECIFKYIPEMVSPQAVSYVRAACDMKYIKNTNNGYSGCIFKVMPDAKTDQAATVLFYSCKNKNADEFE